MQKLGSALLGAAGLVAIVFNSVGCAAMHHGRVQNVILASDPPGAQILADEKQVGVTPDLVTLNRSRRDVAIQLAKDGFHTKHIRIPRRPSAWLAGSAVLAAPFLAMGLYALPALGLTLGVDFGTGAAWELPERVEATLEPRVETLEVAPVRANTSIEETRVRRASEQR